MRFINREIEPTCAKRSAGISSAIARKARASSGLQAIAARGAAVLLVGGVAAGCSADMSRFEASDFAGGQTAASQSYQRGAGIDRTATGSIGERVVRPPAPLSGGSTQRQPQAAMPANNAAANGSGAGRGGRPAALTPDSSSQAVQQKPLPAPSQPGANAGADGQAAAGRPMSQDATPRNAAPQNTGPQDRAAAGNAGGTSVAVQQGETVYGLSRRFGVPVATILQANGLASAADLQAGSTIRIPGAEQGEGERRVAAAPQAAGTASNDGPQPQPEPEQNQAVMRENPKPRSRPEQAPDSASAAGTDSGAGEAEASRGGYTVASGDTLYGIARKTGTSVAGLKAANGLSDGHLQVGQKLVLPSGDGASGQQRTAATESTATQASTEDKNQAGQQAPVVEASAETEAEQTQVAAVASDSEAAAPNSTGIGKLRWPARGRIVSAFGSDNGGTRNDGIDIAVPAGTPIKAAENGVVIYSGDGLKEFGNTILVRHDDGMVTVYGHASALSVKRGDKVRRGQEVALSGMSGNADRPKLHFEVRKDATPVDPSGYLE